MIITQSSVAMASRQQMYLKHARSESLVMWKDGAAPGGADAARGADNPRPVNGADRVTLSPQARKAAPVSKPVDEELPITDMEEMEMELVRRMVEALTGRKIHMVSPREYLKAREEASQEAQEAADALAQQRQNGQPVTADSAAAPAAPEGWGMIYQYHEIRHEQESMVFTAQGKVTTADGKEIDIAVELGMSREFYEEKNIELRAGDAARLTDPLVVNFGGTAAQLTENKFRFDLDSDGHEEQVSLVGGESGLLALDRNDDGIINDGGELFGPATGNGFNELAKHDQDGNLWIDENDDIYQRLRIWNKTPDGGDQLFALGQKGIGALYLGNVQSEFSLKDSANQLQGQVRSSGIYLREDGGAGTMQQIDLAV